MAGAVFLVSMFLMIPVYYIHGTEKGEGTLDTMKLVSSHILLEY